MATIRTTVSRLRVQITEDNQRVITAVIRFNDGTDDQVITIPNLRQDNLTRLIQEFMKTITDTDGVVRDLVKDTNYNIRLQPNGP